MLLEHVESAPVLDEAVAQRAIELSVSWSARMPP